MAALLKKRALAEYSQTTVPDSVTYTLLSYCFYCKHATQQCIIKLQEEAPPPTKYKCVLKPSTSSSTFTFLSLLETSNNNLQLLLRISEDLQFQVRVEA